MDFTPKAGDLCAGFSNDDNYWYRVLVLEGKIKDKVRQSIAHDD